MAWWERVGQDGLSDGEIGALVVGYDVRFLEESAAKGVLRVVSSAAEREVVD